MPKPTLKANNIDAKEQEKRVDELKLQIKTDFDKIASLLGMSFCSNKNVYHMVVSKGIARYYNEITQHVFENIAEFDEKYLNDYITSLSPATSVHHLRTIAHKFNVKRTELVQVLIDLEREFGEAYNPVITNFFNQSARVLPPTPTSDLKKTAVAETYDSIVFTIQ